MMRSHAFYVPVVIGMPSGNEVPGALALTDENVPVLLQSEVLARGQASTLDVIPPEAILYLKQVHTLHDAVYDDAAEAAAHLIVLAKLQGYKVCDSGNC